MNDWAPVRVQDLVPGAWISIRGCQHQVVDLVQVSHGMWSVEGHPVYGRSYVATDVCVWTRREEAGR